MFEKNTLVEVQIEDLTADGEGIGKADGFPVFIKDTVPGDRVVALITKTRKTYAYGRLIKVITPSPKRVKPLCPVAAQCGGCQLQAMSYSGQLRFKENKVYNNLKRIGKFADAPVVPITGMDNPYFYRNKAQIPVRRAKNGDIIFGYYAGRTHSIIQTERCLLLAAPGGAEVSGFVMRAVRRYMIAYKIEPYDEQTHSGLVRNVLIRTGLKTGQVMVCAVINGDFLPHSEALVNALGDIPGIASICVNINRDKGNVLLGKKVVCLYGNGYIEDVIDGVRYRVSPLSFFQVNPFQTEKLYRKVADYAALTGVETVWDLYCGTGSIALYLAKNAWRVIGVEISPFAVKDAQENAKINGIANALFLRGAAEEVVPDYYEKHSGAPECSPDVVVVDPPRKGCGEKLLLTIVKMSPKRVVYVSCDSATLARDLRILADRGYRLEKAAPFDMFPQSVHVETVVLMSRK